MSIAPAIDGAQALALRDEQGRASPLVDPGGGPVVIALASTWDARAAHRYEEPLRAELRGLGATLLVFDRAGLRRIRADDAMDLVTIERAGRPLPIAEATRLLGLSSAGGPAAELAVVLLDPRGRVRFRHVDGATDRGARDGAATLLTALRSAARSFRTDGPRSLIQVTRREILMTTMVAAFALWLGDGCADPPAPPPRSPAPAGGAPGGTTEVILRINGETRALQIEPRVTLLDALREQLGLTGTKKGCDHGQCGSCTVHVGGRRVLACLTLAIMRQGEEITTIEGLAKGAELHPMQAAFLEHDGFQCGFCTPGQIMSAVALVREGHARSRDEIREQMSGNLCRCGAYPNIVAAIESVQGRS